MANSASTPPPSARTVARSKTVRPARRTRSDGERSRRTILSAAARLATIVGLDGLSIGVLADHIGMSKGGLYAHFGSKQELQLATIAAAREVYDAEVMPPVAGNPDALSRLRTLCENYLSYVERQVFPGGCFFASATAELDTRPGPARDLLARLDAEWLDTLSGLAARAQAEGLIDKDEDPVQLTFELNSLLRGANDAFVLHQDPAALSRARQGISQRLRAAAPG